MHKISNFSRMTPAAFGISTRFHSDIPQQPQPLRRPPASTSIGAAAHSEYSTVNLSFNVPFSSSLPGPERDEILHASPGALQRWTFPIGTPEETPTYELPVHVQNQEALRALCRAITQDFRPRVEATVTIIEPKSVQGLHQKSSGVITNVCISGDHEAVQTARASVLNRTPIMMVQSVIPLRTTFWLTALFPEICNR